MEKLGAYEDPLVKVYVFGQNTYGELGLNDTEDRLEPALLVLPPHLKVKKVAAGNEFTLLLSSDGKVYSFGFNGSGQLGLGSTTSAHVPTQIPIPSNDDKVCSIVAANGCEHCFVISSKGNVWAMGYNNYGQLGTHNQLSTSSPILVQDLAKNCKITAATCSYYHSVFIGTTLNTNKSCVLSCGRNENGQLGYGPEMVSLAAKPIVELADKSVTKVACGLHHTAFVTNGGKLYMCGNNENGQLGLKDTRSRYTPTFLEELKAYCFNDVACGYYHTLCLTDHGEAGAIISEPKQIKEFQTVEEAELEACKYVKTLKIACGCYHSVTLSENHEVFTFGRGNHGQLGHGNIFESRMPKQVAGLKNKRVVKIAAGFYHTVVLVDQSSTKAPGSLSATLEKLLKNPLRADVAFIIEGMELLAHRCILYARCRKLDEYVTKEGIITKAEKGRTAKVVVEIPGVSLEVMQRLLKFLYTDKLELQQDKSQSIYTYTRELIELMSLGERFGLDKLKGIAEYYAKKSLSNESTALALKAAYEFKEESFKAQCIEYVMEHFGEVISTPGFSELPSGILREVLTIASKRGVSIRDNQKT